MSSSSTLVEKTRRMSTLKWWATGTALLLLIALGIFARNGWLPHTDPVSGKKYGWLGRPLPNNVASSVWNPVVTSPTPQLSKEYIYAGSRMLAVEDANAIPAPPTDLAIWRPSDGFWWVLGGTGSALTIQQWGMNGDVPVQGDFDGDGKTDFAVFRPSDRLWYIVNSSTGGITYDTWGNASDIPVVADYDGDGKSDVAIWRPSDATYWIQRSSDQGVMIRQWGLPTDIPVKGDFDGDGKADLAVYRPSDGSWWALTSVSGYTANITFTWGGGVGDKPVPADYDGDGKTDFAVIHTDASTQYYWDIKRSSDVGRTYIAWGGSSYPDVPVQNDYDGDGKVDIAIWRPTDGSWWIYQSSAGVRVDHWGMAGDIPVPAYYRR